MKNYLFLMSLALFFSKDLKSQSSLSMNNLPNVWQANAGCWIPKNTKWQLIAPSVGIGLNSDFALNEVITGGGVKIDDNFLQQLQLRDNQISIRQNFQTLGFAKNITENWSFNISQISKSTFDFRFSKDFMQLVGKGNRPFVGKWLDLSSQLNQQTYSEWAAGASWQNTFEPKGWEVGKRLNKWQVGARVKLLMGIDAVQMSPYESKLYTDTLDYHLKFNNQLSVQTVGISTLNDISPRSGTRLVQAGLGSGNMGVGLDLSGALDIGKWQFSASIIDLGSSIAWKSDKTYNSNGEFTYRPRQTDSLGGFRTAFDLVRLRDSLDNIFGIQTTTGAAFSTKIPTQFYANVGYDFSEKMKFTAQFAYLNQMSMGLGVQYKVLPNWTAGVQANYLNQKRVGLGLQSVVTIQDLVQIYVAADDVIQIFNVNNATQTGAQMGINFLFGK